MGGKGHWVVGLEAGFGGLGGTVPDEDQLLTGAVRRRGVGAQQGVEIPAQNEKSY